MIFTKEMLDIWRANPPGGTVSYDIVTSLLDTITDLERQHDENIKQLKIDILAMSQAEEKILLLKSERDTAHAAAIQAAHGIVDTAFTGNWMIQDTLDAVLALTPAASQRIYNLRIAEARLEIVCKILLSTAQKDWSQIERLRVELSAAVDRLKTQAAHV